MLIELTGARDAQTFRQAVIARSGQNLAACLQCGKCTGGCPVAWVVARGPRQLMHVMLRAAPVGQSDRQDQVRGAHGARSPASSAS